MQKEDVAYEFEKQNDYPLKENKEEVAIGRVPVYRKYENDQCKIKAVVTY